MIDPRGFDEAPVKREGLPKELEKVPETPLPPIKRAKLLDIVINIFKKELEQRLINLMEGKMTDYKTTITGFITGLAGLLSAFGIVIPESFFPFIISIGVLILGYLVKDKSGKNP